MSGFDTTFKGFSMYDWVIWIYLFEKGETEEPEQIFRGPFDRFRGRVAGIESALFPLCEGSALMSTLSAYDTYGGGEPELGAVGGRDDFPWRFRTDLVTIQVQGSHEERTPGSLYQELVKRTSP